jgi:arabinan endo-1,5-alpha-L-arabinosidase
MPKRFTRRQFLRSSVVLGAGLSMSLPGLARLQDQTATPEEGVPMHLELSGSIRHIHDPSIIKAGDSYFVFCTGQGIQVRESPDLMNWDIPFPPVVFGSIPKWAKEKIPGQGDIWAPDISYYNDKYHLYYAVSTFGKNRSVIGLATNTTLDSKADGFNWVDEGLVLESTEANNYNCIDPNLIMDTDGVPWLAFGSFWTGIKMRRLDLATGKPSDEDTKLYALAQRFVNFGAVEAPFIIHKGDFYYLFVSFDFCCRGADSTYHVRVGRSENVTGPYVDRDGVEMMKGGGTQVTFPTDRWKGPGHNSILQDNGIEYIVYHSYDAQNVGVPTLRIDPLVWDADGWPSIMT